MPLNHFQILFVCLDQSPEFSEEQTMSESLLDEIKENAILLA